MHMSDALLSPVVGGVMTAVSVGTLGYSVRQISKDALSDKKIPMMGVMGAFVFAGQMINFTIPVTGSSGHIGGGILLSALLGPFAALLTLASVLLIQCLFFADGGLLAFGCNVFNMGVVACLLAYPLIFKPIVRRGLNRKTITIASIASVILGLQIGAFGVVLETLASGVTELPFAAFAALMQPIHLAIGLVEGIVTAAVLVFIYNARPELLDANSAVPAAASNRAAAVLLAVSVVVAGVVAAFASAKPDGLEWSIAKITSELEGGEAAVVLLDYDNALARVIGVGITILLVCAIGFSIRAARRRRKA
ncbi:cobalamin biosynthesis protein CbiM [Clostridia bacterium]|nr:cobalamin biosynthesis protein CbiM [Clostridia bacterium]